MAVDFNKVPKGELEFIYSLAKAWDNTPREDCRIIQFQGGYVPLGGYESWVEHGSKGELLVSQTELGAELATFISTWCDINVKALKHAGTLEADDVRFIQHVGSLAVQVCGAATTPQAYALWKQSNLNTPADMSETALRLAYTSELLMFAEELAADGAQNRTLH